MWINLQVKIRTDQRTIGTMMRTIGTPETKKMTLLLVRYSCTFPEGHLHSSKTNSNSYTVTLFHLHAGSLAIGTLHNYKHANLYLARSNLYI